MNRRDMVLALFATVVAPLSAKAQRAQEAYRIGYLGNTKSISHTQEAFRQGLRDLGWVEGQSILIEYRWAEGNFDRFPILAEELVRLKVDVIVAAGAVPAALAAKNATKTIPIVFPVAGAPVETGLVASLARPGGNVTGIAVLFPELSMKRLELLNESLPRLARLAVLWNAANPAKTVDWRAVQVAARTLGVTLQSVELRGPDDFESAFARLQKESPDGLLTLDDPLTLQYRKRIVDFAAASRLPAIYAIREFVDAGGLMAYAPNFAEMFRRSAAYVDKILKGRKPAELPVEQPMRFELLINLKTARATGITIPRALLLRADELLE